MFEITAKQNQQFKEVRELIYKARVTLKRINYHSAFNGMYSVGPGKQDSKDQEIRELKRLVSIQTEDEVCRIEDALDTLINDVAVMHGIFTVKRAPRKKKAKRQATKKVAVKKPPAKKKVAKRKATKKAA